MKDDGGSAFPFSRSWENERKGYSESESADGMTLRDYFAIHAPEPDVEAIRLQQDIDRSRNPHNDGPPKPRIRDGYEIRSALRYRYADAMLAERSKT